MLSFECIKNEKSVYFLLTSARGLAFGQPVPLLRACCPFSRVFGFSRTWFWAAGTFSPRLLPIFSSNQLPAEVVS